MTPIKTAWDEAGSPRWTARDQRNFDAAFRAWAKRTGNQTSFEIRMELGQDEFSQAERRRRRNGAAGETALPACATELPACATADRSAPQADTSGARLA